MRWVIGDIHGMYKPLEAMLREIERIDASPRYFFVGDYVNRGPESSKVLERLSHLPNARFCRGNHDDTFDLILNGHSFDAKATGVNPLMAYSWFMQHGLAQTLASYGLDLADLHLLAHQPDGRKLADMLTAVPQHHRAFIRALEPVIEEPDLFVAHAAWPLDEADGPGMAQQLYASAPLRHNVVWGRYTLAEVAKPKKWKRPGYFGHTPVINYTEHSNRNGNVPLTGPSIMLLDTGAALGPQGRLTAVCCETGQYLQCDPQGAAVGAPVAK